MPASFHRFLDQAFDDSTLDEVLAASPAALSGVSQADAHALATALGIATIHDLATNRYFAAARALLAATGTPAFDPGPPPDWEATFATAPDYAAAFPSRFRVEFGPVYYRGRLDGSARLLVIGQDPSSDEILAQRIFVGQSGQRVQGLLRKLGLTRSYAMINTFLFSVHGQFDTELRQISVNPRVLGYRNEVLDRLAAENELEAVIAVGSGAHHALDHWPGGAALPVHRLVHPAAPEATVLPNWNENLPALRQEVAPDDGVVPDNAHYGDHFTAADVADIPAADLPFGVPRWHGTGGGTRSKRNGDHEIDWTAP
jgi:Uracil DNA glycosylase superfamily